MTPSILKPEREDALDYMPISWDDILSFIRRDQSACDGFFHYYPGFTTKQHAEVEIEELREQRSQEHEKTLTEWSISQEKRLVEWSNAQENRWHTYEVEREKTRLKTEETWKNSGKRLVIIFGILGLLFTGMEILANSLIARYLH